MRYIWLLAGLLWFVDVTPANSVYKCSQGQVGFLVVTEGGADGSVMFWLAKKTGETVDPKEVICFMPGDMKIMVLGPGKEL